MDSKYKKEILKYLAKHKLMSVGTYHKTPWAASVYFLCDDNLNFYFVSDPQTRHCRNIFNNPEVSVTVADSRQKSTDTKVGFQASGVAKRITSIKEVKDVINAWNNNGFVPVTYKIMMKKWKSRFYKIKLKEVQMFDENQPEEFEVKNWKI